jgi:hypothetical protein
VPKKGLPASWPVGRRSRPCDGGRPDSRVGEVHRAGAPPVSPARDGGAAALLNGHELAVTVKRLGPALPTRGNAGPPLRPTPLPGPVGRRRRTCPPTTCGPGTPPPCGTGPMSIRRAVARPSPWSPTISSRIRCLPASDALRYRDRSCWSSAVSRPYRSCPPGGQASPSTRIDSERQHHPHSLEEHEARRSLHIACRTLVSGRSSLQKTGRRAGGSTA